VDGNGNVVGSNDYDAFDAVRATSGSASTAYRNAGHAADDAVGLVYMRARWYDPALGRFLTPDPLLPHSLNGQDWNHYVYGRNNPMMFVDLEGQGVLDIVAGWGTLAYSVANKFIALLRVPQIVEQQIEAPLYKIYHFEQFPEQEVNAAPEQVIQGFRNLHEAAWKASIGPGTIYSPIFGKPGVPDTWQEALVKFGLKQILGRLYSLPSRRAIDRTTRQQYGVGALESADPSRGMPYYYVPSSVPGLYFRSGTVIRPSGSK